MPIKMYNDFLDKNIYSRKLNNVDLDPVPSAYIYLNGKPLLNFSSNDYLALSRHPLLIQRSQEFINRWGIGMCSSRLVAGNLAIYEELENQLAVAIGKPAALILGSGYQANISVIEALLDASVLKSKPIVFCDRYCHASMLAMTHHLSHLKRFKHNDLVHLENLLKKESKNKSPKFILVESLYSMDGDKTNLEKLIALAGEYEAFIYVDDAHSVGMFGVSGWGIASEFSQHIDLIVGTFSKALGSYGSYVACSKMVREFLVNKCKGLIYSTAISPAVAGAISAAIDLIPTLHETRMMVVNHAKRLRHFFKENNVDYGLSETHIVPWIVGDADKTMRVSEKLIEKGILAVCIRPPTVPKGTSRIRFCITAQHTDADIDYLIDVLKKII